MLYDLSSSIVSPRSGHAQIRPFRTAETRYVNEFASVRSRLSSFKTIKLLLTLSMLSQYYGIMHKSIVVVACVLIYKSHLDIQGRSVQLFKINCETLTDAKEKYWTRHVLSGCRRSRDDCISLGLNLDN